MSLLTLSKTVVDRSLKLTRTPIDFALGATGLKRESPEQRAAQRAAERQRQRADPVGGKRDANGLREATQKAKEARKKID